MPEMITSIPETCRDSCLRLDGSGSNRSSVKRPGPLFICIYIELILLGVKLENDGVLASHWLAV